LQPYWSFAPVMMLGQHKKVFATVLFNSCAKDGAPGATGPQGPAGNPNISTVTINVASSQWIADYANNRYYVGLSVPDITSNVFSNGTVNVFVDDGSGTFWNALPYSFNDNEYDYQIHVGEVYINYTVGTGGMPLNSPGFVEYKVVVIPN
jgi:hypothetical protein